MAADQPDRSPAPGIIPQAPSRERCRIASEVARRMHRGAIMLEDRCDQVQRWVARATALVSPSLESAVGALVAH